MESAATSVACRPMATIESQQHPLGRVEFTLLLAMAMALTALGIDIMLPALGDIRSAYDLAEDSTAVAALITVYMLGLALPQLVYGPLSDRFGRKPIMNVGFVIYIIGAVAAALAPSLAALLVARFIWGVGAAGPRGVTVSIIRDRYEGDPMARAMSFVFAIFVIVPVVAPTLGALLSELAGWRAVFLFCAAWAGVIAIWAIRLPETLKPEYRMELRMSRVLGAANEVVTNRVTAGYTVALTFLMGVFLSYIASSELIIEDVFDLDNLFPVIFGVTAALVGAALLANGTIVSRFGTRRLSHAMLMGYLALAVLFTLVALATAGRPSFWLFAASFVPALVCFGLIFPNFNTIAMIPMGHIAGTASALITATSLAGAALLGAILDQAYNGTVLPLAFGVLVYGLIALSAVLWAEQGKLFVPLKESAELP